MKVLAGYLKGRNFNIGSHKSRPTMDRVRKSLFDTLGSLEGKDILDLYSGSGSLAIESISRGAEKAIMIDYDPYSIKEIINSVNSLGISDKCRAYLNKVDVGIKVLGRKGDKFDIIFMDPPYFYDLYSNDLDEIIKNDILKDDGLVIIEHKSKAKVDNCNFKIVDIRKYGGSTLTFLRKEK